MKRNPQTLGLHHKAGIILMFAWFYIIAIGLAHGEGKKEWAALVQPEPIKLWKVAQLESDDWVGLEAAFHAGGGQFDKRGKIVRGYAQ